tara:strand:+ start:6514 stop:6813 length:300 start_codon:yes stop_codon:yes gene_type:complete
MKKFISFKAGASSETTVNFGSNGIIFWGPSSNDDLVCMYTGSGNQGLLAEPSNTSLADLQAAADALADAYEAKPGGLVVYTSADIASSSLELSDCPIQP